MPRREVATVAAALLIAMAGPIIDVVPATAQTAALEQSDQPVTVEADQGIEWLREEKLYVARGNAKVVRGDLTVTADTVTAQYRDTDTQSNEIHRLEANGNVVITTPGRTAWGDRAIYDLDQSVVVLLGDGLRLKTPTDEITARDSLEYWEKRQLAVARGDAVATRADRRIEANALTARFTEGKTGDLEVTRMDAVGGVRITTPREIALGKDGIYDVVTGIATLSGDVRITRGDNQLNGEMAELNLNTGVSRILAQDGGKQRVKGLFKPKKTNEKDDQG